MRHVNINSDGTAINTHIYDILTGTEIERVKKIIFLDPIDADSNHPIRVILEIFKDDKSIFEDALIVPPVNRC